MVLHRLYGLVWAGIALFFLTSGNSNLRPSYAGSPFGSGDCSSCHSGESKLSGSVVLEGIPEVALPGEEYMITVRLNLDAPSLLRSKNNEKGGFLITTSDTTTTQGEGMGRLLAGPKTQKLNDAFREYIGHEEGQEFDLNNKSDWTFPWIAPDDKPGVCFNFYVSSLIADGDASQDGDFTINKIISSKMYTPMTLQLNIDKTISCNASSDGEVSVAVTGGQGPYQYTWSNNQNTPMANNLGEGIYEVTVTDAKNQSKSETINLSAPEDLSIELVGNNPACHGDDSGYISTSIEGGTGPYSYNWSNGKATKDLETIPAGLYQLTIVDMNGCQLTESIELNDPKPIDFTSVITPITCFGAGDGVISLAGSGGTGSISYQWSNGNSGSFDNGLAGGIYTITATDENKCSCIKSVELLEPEALSTSIEATPIRCHGESNGSLTVIPLGGTPPYQYKWNHQNAKGTSIENLGPATYTVTVTDENFCEGVANIVMDEPPVLEVTTVTEKATGPNFQDGKATALVEGGIPPYLYSWSSGHVSPIADNLVPGTYEVIITDSLGCQKIASVTIEADNTSAQSASHHTSEIRIYPNPVDDFIKIDWPEYLSPYLSIHLWNSSGKLIQEIPASSNNNISLKHLSPGLYWIQLNGKSGTYQTKILKL